MASEIEIKGTIRVKSRTAQEWGTENPVLAAGEPGQVSDSGKLKMGDGKTRWNALPYLNPALRPAPLAVNEVMSEYVPIRPKGHVFYVGPSAQYMQVCSIMPNRKNLQDGTAVNFGMRDFSVPVANKRYAEVGDYQLRYVNKKANYTGFVHLQLNCAMLPSSTVNIRVPGYKFTVWVCGTSFPSGQDIPSNLLMTTSGVVQLNLAGGLSAHVKVLVEVKDLSGYQGHIFRVDDKMQYEDLGAYAGLPYVGHINPRSPKTGIYPGRSLYAEKVSSSNFVAGCTFLSHVGDFPAVLADTLGFNEAFNELKYRLFVRVRSARGTVYIALKNNEFSEIFGQPRDNKLYAGSLRRALKKIVDYKKGYFRISFIECCFAKPRYHKGYKGEKTVTMDMKYPRFYFKIRSVKKNSYNADPTITGKDKFTTKSVWQAVEQ